MAPRTRPAAAPPIDGRSGPRTIDFTRARHGAVVDGMRVVRCPACGKRGGLERWERVVSVVHSKVVETHVFRASRDHVQCYLAPEHAVGLVDGATLLRMFDATARAERRADVPAAQRDKLTHARHVFARALCAAHGATAEGLRARRLAPLRAQLDELQARVRDLAGEMTRVAAEPPEGSRADDPPAAAPTSPPSAEELTP